MSNLTPEQLEQLAIQRTEDIHAWITTLMGCGVSAIGIIELTSNTPLADVWPVLFFGGLLILGPQLVTSVFGYHIEDEDEDEDEDEEEDEVDWGDVLSVIIK